MKRFYTFLGIAAPLAEIAKRFAWSVPVVAVLGFIGNGLEGLGISLLIPFLAILFSEGTPSELPGPLSAVAELASSLPAGEQLAAIAAIILASIVLKALVLSANAMIVSWVDGKAGHEIRCALSRQLLNVGYGFHIANDPARFLNIISTESWRASDAIRKLFSMIGAAGAVAVFSLILIVIEWRLSIAVLFGVILIRGIQSVAAKRLRAMSHSISEANRRLATRMITVVQAARLIRLFGLEKLEQRRFEETSDQVRSTMFRVDAASAPLLPAIEVLYAALFIGTLFGGQSAGIAVPVVVTFLVLLYRMQPHFRLMSQSRLDLAGMWGSITEVESLLDAVDKSPPPSGHVPFRHLGGPIAFENVSFFYEHRPDAVPALHEVTFQLLANQATALIGRSGAGKTTAVNLLCRLLDPTSGRITIDGTDLRLIDPASWRSRIGFAGQDIELIDGTVFENIAYGDADATLAEAVVAAKFADADRFIQAFPQGYGTQVGSRGLGLSGGQRQRIGIARALVRNPEILILDEAMSSVDSISETAIVSLLRGRLKGMTVIVISHRASTLACCEKGVVIEEGRVIETGPLAALKAYQRMGAATGTDVDAALHGPGVT
ncbi:MAG: ABC transporter ATP-binding protein [Hyphomicrobiales bacterium]|nr:ABC transporter ATP-binding protein [Hyphomicrobiales bacterium]